MPKFDASWTGKLRVIGDLERQDHFYLTGEDDCAFFGEYTPRDHIVGPAWEHSATNQLIFNLKKSPTKQHTPQWPHKLRAITDVGRAIAANLNPDQLDQIAFVPIPPSKPSEHPEYDDRMVKVARAIRAGIDVREVIYTAAVRDAAHAQQHHRDPVALRASLAVRAQLVATQPNQAILLDDALTTGCSFRVCKTMLDEIWPGTAVFGLFVARRIIPQIDPAQAFAGVEF